MVKNFNFQLIFQTLKVSQGPKVRLLFSVITVHMSSFPAFCVYIETLILLSKIYSLPSMKGVMTVLNIKNLLVYIAV